MSREKISTSLLRKEKMVVGGGVYMLDDGQKIGPLFVATAATLTENNKARVYVYVEKFDEVSSIGRNDCEIVVASILPYLMVWQAR